MKVNYSVDSSGVHIQGVTTSNPVIYDNDMILDTPELFFLWLKANKGQVNLVGNVNTQDLFIPPNIVHSHDSTFVQWTDAYNKAIAIGLKNIPKPVKGSDDYLRRPASGVPEQTVRKDSVGSDLIILEARKCTAAKPLVIFVGGQVTSIANAYLKDNSIADKIVVLHVDGWDKTDYNGVDYWANEIVVRKMLYCNWDGSFINNQTTWYDPFRPLQVNFNGIPSNPWTKLLIDNYYNQAYARWKDVGDAPPVFWFFDNSTWKNVVRRTAAKQTVTGDTYDYILVSDNDWPKYGAMLSAYMVNHQNYIPGTVEPPVNNAPTISILTPNTTYPAGSSIIITATASDDKAVSKVEFFNGSIKLGESLTSPYSWVINNATAGTYNLTGKATDNEGASTVSSVRVVTVSGVVVQPPQYPVEFVIGTVIEGPVPKVTIRAGSPPSKPILDFELQRGPQGIPGSGNTKDVAKYNVMDFGAKGTGGTVDDSIAFQNCANAAILGCGDFVIPPPPVEYVISKTIVMKSPTNQIWMNLTSWGWGAGTNHIEYRGPSNSSVFYVVGLKSSTWQGLKVRTNEGLSNVVTYDFDATPAAQSTTFNTIRNFYTDLGNQSGNIAFRLGRMKEGENHGDICHYSFENSVVYGKFQDPQPNTIGYQILGRNAVGMSFFNCFTAFCDIKYTNKAIDGRRGNGCVSFYTCGSSQNNIDFSIHSEQTYLISGGRYEGTKKRFLEVLDGAHAAVKCDTVQIDEIGEGDKSGNFNQLSPFLISSSSTLSIEDCIVNQKAINKSHLVDIVYQGPNKSTLKISGGAVRSSAPALYKGKNQNIRVYIEGVNKNKLGDIYSTDIWPDERP